MIRSLPLRVRLTIWYSLAVAACMFSIGFISLWMVHRAIDDLENEELQQRVRSVSRFLESRPAAETPDQLRKEVADDFSATHGNKWLQVIDEHGNWLYRSPHVAAVYPTLVLPGQAPRSGQYFTYKAESTSVRGLIATIDVRGVRYTVQTGHTLTDTLAVLSDFRFQLFLLITVGLLVSSLAGYFLSRKALTPIADLAAEAARIHDRNLDIRLPVPASQDEISALSHTLNQMLERIEKAFASVRSFTGNASHELRTPISLLRTEIEVALLRPRQADEYRAVLERLHGETMRMTGLVENLLSLARADGGAEAISLQPLSVDLLLQQSAETWKSAMSRAMLDFNVDLPETDPVVLGDRHGIERLLSILLENASKYTPPGGSVTLSAAVEGEQVFFSVKDTGIGIAPDEQQRIFDRFYRGVRIGDATPTGSGLGLAIGKWIADRHGATLCVQSESGKGARFRFALQRIAPSTEAAAFGHAANNISKNEKNLSLS